MRAAPIVVLAASLASAHPLPAAGPPASDARFSASRCFDLIAFFDEVVQSRFDTRTLLIEDWALQEARRWRLQAEADCAAGNLAAEVTRLGARIWSVAP